MDDNSSLPSTTATFPLWDGWNHDPLLNSTLAPGGLHSSSQYQEPSPVFDGCASPNNLTQVTPVNQSDNNVLWGNEVLSMVEQPLFVHDVYPAQGWIQDGPSGSAGMQGMLAPFHYEAFVNGVAPSEIIAPSTAIQERGFSHPTINDTGLTENERDSAFTCIECNFTAKSHGDLDRHAFRSGHSSYQCREDDCTSVFSRSADLSRHQLSHDKVVRRYPCNLCRKYRSPRGFLRQDHLTQHQRGYHNIEAPHSGRPHCRTRACPREECPFYLDQSRVLSRAEATFHRQSDYTNHMKKVHDESPYPCEEPGCSRVGGKGYYSKKALRKHGMKEHGKKATDPVI